MVHHWRPLDCQFSAYYITTDRVSGGGEFRFCRLASDTDQTKTRLM
jgi:hypothetical protein